MHRTYRQCLAALARSFSGRRLGAISAFDVERHKRARLEAGVRVMVNRELAVLRALYNRCGDWGKYEGEKPVGKVRPMKALMLRWSDIDLRRGLLTVQSAYAKSGKTRTDPLNRPALAALRALRERTGDRELVFAHRDGSPYRSIRTAFQTACRRAGLTDVTPHVLRHTFASRLAMTGAHPRAIQELGGWSEHAIVERYAHLSAGHKAEAVERLALTEKGLHDDARGALRAWIT